MLGNTLDDLGDVLLCVVLDLDCVLCCALNGLVAFTLLLLLSKNSVGVVNTLGFVKDYFLQVLDVVLCECRIESNFPLNALYFASLGLVRVLNLLLKASNLIFVDLRSMLLSVDDLLFPLSSLLCDFESSKSWFTAQVSKR